MTDSTREMMARLRRHLTLKISHPHFAPISDDCYEAAVLLTQQAERIAELKDENACDVCAGTGTPTSGKPCICAGTGKASQAFMQLRIDYYDLESRLAAAEARAERAEKDAERYRWLRQLTGVAWACEHEGNVGNTPWMRLNELLDAAIDAAKEQGNG